MSEVTTSNFERLCPEIEAAIAGAAFIAVDTEFTGLVREPEATPSLFDSAEDRYNKLRQSVSSYIICQVGICTFTPVSGKSLYKAQAFSVYLCPRSFGNVDPQFSVQASSVEFLCQYGFDFNKCFYKGVPYTDRSCRRALDAYLRKEQSRDKPQLAEIYDRVRRWLDNNNRSEGGGKSLILVPPEGLAVPLVMADLRARFPAVEFDMRVEGLHLTLADDVGRAEHSDEASKGREPSEEELRNSLLGFSRCFEALVASGKPLVGHNVLMDLLLFYHQFCEPLPKSYAKLKTALSTLFPEVYDTKHIALEMRQQVQPWLKNYLEAGDLFSLHKAMCELPMPFAPHAEGTPKGLRAHEAGCDAYAAGFVFLRLAHIAAHQLSEVPAPTLQPVSWPHLHTSIRPFVNRINMIRAQCHHVSLHGPDTVSEARPPWMCVRSTGRSEGEIRGVLARCGVVDVRYLFPGCLLVATGNFTCARDIVDAFDEDPAVRVLKYSRLKHDPGMRKWLWAGAFLGLAMSAGCALQLAPML
ncbi:poly(A)-specific ribonuclease PNLDC1-like [Haemaphysalis longicornis]